MKKLLRVLFVFVLFSSMALYSNAMHPFHKTHKSHHSRHGHTQHRHGQPVGAPLDGGLLVVLGAAGIGYYVARKNKKKA